MSSTSASSRGSRRRLVFVPVAGLAVLAITVAGCGGSESPKTTSTSTPSPTAAGSWVAPASGTCIADRVDGDVGWEHVVPCSAPHTYEVLGSAPLPAEFSEAARDDLEMASGILHDQYLTFANKTCDDVVTQTLGWADTPVGTVSGREVSLAPAFSGALSLALSPATSWESTKTLVCSWRFEDPNKKTFQVASTSGTAAFQSFTDGSFPISATVCENYKNGKDGTDGNVPVDCSKPHLQQYLVSFNLKPVVGAAWIEKVGTRAFTDAEWAQLDAICKPLITELIGASKVSGKSVMADTGALWGDSKYLPDYYQVRCMVRDEVKGTLLTGSVL